MRDLHRASRSGHRCLPAGAAHPDALLASRHGRMWLPFKTDITMLDT
jgi:hypothetical protein